MKIIKNTLHGLIILLVPVILLLTALRLLMTPLFVQVEFRTPNFPVDSYGFTQEDRLKYAPIALEYLLNDAGEEFLGDLKFRSFSLFFLRLHLCCCLTRMLC